MKTSLLALLFLCSHSKQHHMSRVYVRRSQAVSIPYVGGTSKANALMALMTIVPSSGNVLVSAITGANTATAGNKGLITSGVNGSFPSGVTFMKNGVVIPFNVISASVSVGLAIMASDVQSRAYALNGQNYVMDEQLGAPITSQQLVRSLAPADLTLGLRYGSGTNLGITPVPVIPTYFNVENTGYDVVAGANIDMLPLLNTFQVANNVDFGLDLPSVCPSTNMTDATAYAAYAANGLDNKYILAAAVVTDFVLEVADSMYTATGSNSTDGYVIVSDVCNQPGSNLLLPSSFQGSALNPVQMMPVPFSNGAGTTQQSENRVGFRLPYLTSISGAASVTGGYSKVRHWVQTPGVGWDVTVISEFTASQAILNTNPQLIAPFPALTGGTAGPH